MLLLIIVTVFTAWSLAQTTGAEFTAEQLVQNAFVRNADLLAVRQRNAEVAGLLVQAGIRPNPGIELSVSNGALLGSSGEREVSVSFAQTFEVGGKRDRRIEVANWTAELARFEIADRERRLAAEVKSGFGRVLGAERNLQILRSLLETNEQGFRLTEARVQEGEAPKLESALLRVELNRLKADHLLFESQRTRAARELRTVSGVDANIEIRLIGDLLPRAIAPISLPTLVERALEQRPDLQAAEIHERLADAESRLAKAEAKPDPLAFVRYSRIHSRFDQLGFSAPGVTTPIRDTDNILTAGVAISLPTRNRNQGNIDAAAAREQAARLRRAFLERQVREEVESAYNRYVASRDAAEIISRDVIAQASENIATVRAAYELGELRLFDVVAEQRRLIDMQKTYTDLLQDHFVALVQLEQAVGGALQ